MLALGDIGRTLLRVTVIASMRRTSLVVGVLAAASVAGCGHASKLWGMDVKDRDEEGRNKPVRAPRGNERSGGLDAIMKQAAQKGVEGGLDMASMMGNLMEGVELETLLRETLDSVIAILEDPEQRRIMEDPSTVQELLEGLPIPGEVKQSSEYEEMMKVLDGESLSEFKDKVHEVLGSALRFCKEMRRALGNPIALGQVLREHLAPYGLPEDAIPQIVELLEDPQPIIDALVQSLSDPTVMAEMNKMTSSLLGSANSGLEGLLDDPDVMEALLNDPALLKEALDDPMLRELLGDLEGNPEIARLMDEL